MTMRHRIYPTPAGALGHLLSSLLGKRATGLRHGQQPSSRFVWILEACRHIHPPKRSQHDTPTLPSPSLAGKTLISITGATHKYRRSPVLATTPSRPQDSPSCIPEHGPAQRFHPGVSVDNLAFHPSMRGSIVNRNVLCLAKTPQVSVCAYNGIIFALRIPLLKVNYKRCAT